MRQQGYCAFKIDIDIPSPSATAFRGVLHLPGGKVKAIWKGLPDLFTCFLSAFLAPITPIPCADPQTRQIWLVYQLIPLSGIQTWLMPMPPAHLCSRVTSSRGLCGHAWKQQQAFSAPLEGDSHLGRHLIPSVHFCVPSAWNAASHTTSLFNSPLPAYMHRLRKLYACNLEVAPGTLMVPPKWKGHMRLWYHTLCICGPHTSTMLLPNPPLTLGRDTSRWVQNPPEQGPQAFRQQGLVMVDHFSIVWGGGQFRDDSSASIYYAATDLTGSRA